MVVFMNGATTIFKSLEQANMNSVQVQVMNKGVQEKNQGEMLLEVVVKEVEVQVNNMVQTMTMVEAMVVPQAHINKVEIQAMVALEVQVMVVVVQMMVVGVVQIMVVVDTQMTVIVVVKHMEDMIMPVVVVAAEVKDMEDIIMVVAVEDDVVSVFTRNFS